MILQDQKENFVNAIKIYQFKAKDSEIKPYQLFLGNILKDFAVNNMVKKGLNGFVYNFSVDNNIMDISDIINSHKYLRKKHVIK